jgi:hypothetical protein
VDLFPYLNGKFIGFPDHIKDPEARKRCECQWAYFGGLTLGIAAMLYEEKKVENQVCWGHDWNQNDNLSDQSFVDAPHFELVL